MGEQKTSADGDAGGTVRIRFDRPPPNASYLVIAKRNGAALARCWVGQQERWEQYVPPGKTLADVLPAARADIMGRAWLARLEWAISEGREILGVKAGAECR